MDPDLVAAHLDGGLARPGRREPAWCSLVHADCGYEDSKEKKDARSEPEISETLERVQRGRPRALEELNGNEAKGSGDEGNKPPVDEATDDFHVALVGEKTNADRKSSLLGGAGNAIDATGQAAQDRKKRNCLVGERFA